MNAKRNMQDDSADLAYFKKVYARAAQQIGAELQKITPLVASTFKNEDPLRTAAERFILQGGKRFRPALAYVVAKSYGQNDLWPHLALETFHKYILVHDDIIDTDIMRYGKPTVHAKMAEFCPENADAKHFGNSLAIVSGDLIEASTYKIILSSKLEDSKKVELCKLIPDAMDEVGWGWYDQFLMDYEPIDSPTISLERIKKSIVWVTGKYTIKLPMQFGFTLASQQMPKQIEDFAAAAGLLFQTGDDLMGLFGNQQETGKSNSGDISQGKKTLPIWLAYAAADRAGKQLLKKHLGNKNITKDQVEQVRELIKLSGAVDQVKQLMQEFKRESLLNIEQMQAPQELKKFLRGFIYYIEKRDR